MADGVQASLAFLVSGDVDEKQDCLRRFDEVSESLSSYAEVARVDKPGEERERDILDAIRARQAELEQYASRLFQKLQETGGIDTVVLRQYRDVIDRTFAAIDELVALEHDEVREVQELALVVGGVLRQAFQRAEEALAEQQALRDRFVERSIAVQDNERQRVARELHDETGQALSALSVGLRELSESPDLTSVRSTAQRLRRTAEGLITSTMLNLIVLPSLYLRFGRHTPASGPG